MNVNNLITRRIVNGMRNISCSLQSNKLRLKAITKIEVYIFSVCSSRILFYSVEQFPSSSIECTVTRAPKCVNDVYKSTLHIVMCIQRKQFVTKTNQRLTFIQMWNISARTLSFNKES